MLALGTTPNISGKSTGMDKFIQTLLNGYENPAVLSNAENGTILFSNQAAQNQLGMASRKLSGSRLPDLFKARYIVQHNVIWEYRQQHYKINQEKLVLSGDTYVKSILKPLKKGQGLDFLDLQKEMSQLLVHRFHSPLTGVMGFTELLLDMDLTEKQARYIDAITDGLEEFKGILARVDELAQEVNVHTSSRHTRNFINELMSAFSPGNRQRINVVIDPAREELESDFVLLKQMLTELLQNALEHGRGPDKRVTLNFCKNDTIRITNYGSQIPKELSKKMFYPFFSTKARGLGLGLSKCAFYARELGYEIILAENSSVNGISFDLRMR